ncbi:MAG: hypothetical protein ACP5KS_14850, partial [Candidatus Hydrogenedens sp.]
MDKKSKAYRNSVFAFFMLIFWGYFLQQALFANDTIVSNEGITEGMVNGEGVIEGSIEGVMEGEGIIEGSIEGV